MEKFNNQEQEDMKSNKTKIFSVPFSSLDFQEDMNISIITNFANNPSKEQIINQAINAHTKGDIKIAKNILLAIYSTWIF